MIPKYLIIHHSETSDGKAKDWDAIRRYHKDVRGWSDIGYHYGIERVNGEIAVQVGRSESTPGAQCKEAGMNHKSLGLCVVGNFDKAAPDEEKLGVLRGLCTSLMAAYGIPPENVLGHAEAQMLELDQPTKTCPGKMFDLNDFRASIGGKYETV